MIYHPKIEKNKYDYKKLSNSCGYGSDLLPKRLHQFAREYEAIIKDVIKNK